MLHDVKCCSWSHANKKNNVTFHMDHDTFSHLFHKDEQLSWKGKKS